MKKSVTILLVCISFLVRGQDWSIIDETDGQIFPSAVLCLANINEDKLKELAPNEINEIGNKNGWIFLRISTSEPYSKIKIELNETNFFKKSVFEYTLPQANYEYDIYPEIIWDYEKLLNNNQPAMVNFTMKVSINEKELGQKNKIISIRSINECLYGIVDPETGEYTDLSFFFAAYVNENNPLIDEILKQALDTRIINSFSGYQHDEEKVESQIFSIWYVLQQQGFKYSSITKTSQASKVIRSQRVRPFETSLSTSQANCVDGTVLFASILRAIGIDPILILVPGHMFLGYYLNDKHTSYSFLETTMLGDVHLEDYSTSESQFAKSLESFERAKEYAINRVQNDESKFTDVAFETGYKMIDISDELRSIIQPIGK